MNAASGQDTSQLVVFVIGGERYALPLPSTGRVLPMVAVSPLPKAPDVVLGVLNLHGSIIPVVDIRRRLGFPPRDYGLTAHLLVARTSRRTLALPVDEVLGVREVPADAVTTVGDLFPGIDHLSGIVAIGDGVLYIYDLDAFLSLDEERYLGAALGEAGA